MVRAKATAAERAKAEQRETALATRRLTKEAEGDDARQRERREWSHSMMMQNRELCKYWYEQRQRMAQDEKDVDRRATGERVYESIWNELAMRVMWWSSASATVVKDHGYHDLD